MAKLVGVVIEGSFLPYEVLYYEAPQHLDIEVGDRVLVPLGSSNTPKAAYVLKIGESQKEEFPSIEIKKVIDIIEKGLFSNNIAQLFIFVSEIFLVPLHALINNIYGTFTEKDFKIFVNVLKEDALEKYLEKAKSKDNIAILNLLKTKNRISIDSIKAKTGLKLEDVKEFIKSLRKRGIVSLEYIPPKDHNYFLKIKDEVAFDKILHDRNTPISVRKILLGVKKGGLVYFDDAIASIKNGESLVDFLIEEGVLEIVKKEKNLLNKNRKEFLIVDSGSLEERARYIANFLKDNLSEHGRALIVVNEISIANILKEYYGRELGIDIPICVGGEKSELRRQLSLGRKVIISTPFSLFVDVDNLEYIIIEDASSKYHLPSEFLDFDTRMVAYKRSELENVSLIFSTYSFDDLLYFFYKEKNFSLKELKDTKMQNKRIIDMRYEYKAKNLSPISLYLESKIKQALEKGENIALVLNRKPYSTFIVCRECGYIARCPVCTTTLHFDAEKNKLFCPICGHEESPIEKCPRCGSMSISYLGYGIQKLAKDIESKFKDAKLVVLESGETEGIFDSSKFERTIFLGTEFLFSHLKFNKVSFIAFVSADTFLNGSDLYTSLEAFKFFRQGSLETYPHDVFLQSYTKDNYVLQYFKKDNQFGFIKQELSFRKVLQYPPFFHFIELYFKKENELDKLKAVFKEEKIFGPVEKFYKKSTIFEITIRTKRYPKEVLKLVMQNVDPKNIIGARVYPAPTLLF